jgi:hypothetical protein
MYSLSHGSSRVTKKKPHVYDGKALGSVESKNFTAPFAIKEFLQNMG